MKVTFRQDKYFTYFGVFLVFHGSGFLNVLLRFKMSSNQTNKDKARSAKCHHFCFAFDSHNYCPTCRDAGKGDDHCVTFEAPCEICSAFSKEQLIKITHRKGYVKKQKRDTSKDDELDLLGEEDIDSFTG